MLRRLTLGLLLLAAAVAAACSTNTTTPSSGGVPGVGPNFVTNTLYVADTSAGTIDIYTPAPGPSATPQYAIFGSNTGLSGPMYMAFNSSKQLYVTNYASASKASTILIYQTYATGDVLAFNAIPIFSGSIARGIAFLPNGDMAVAITSPGQTLTSSLQVYNTTPFLTFNIGGTSTGLSAPAGVAADASNRIYVGNSTGASVTVYSLPSPSPTPSSTPTPTPTPSPTPSPTGSPLVTPTPSPTPTPAATNLPPVMTFTSGLTAPSGVAVDAAGNLYVADSGSATTAPSVVIFKAPLSSGMAFSAKITSSSFVDPTDVKVDTSGNIYVVDAGTGPGNSKLLIFKPGTNGPATPSTTIALPTGTATGAALSP